MTQVKYTWSDVEAAVASIQVSMHKRLWIPDYVVGYREGGAVPGVMLASRLGVTFYHLDKDETNCWMAEEAAGGPTGQDKKHILIVTDYNRYGEDLNWIKRDWAGSIHADPWKDVWHKNVRFAALLDNSNSGFDLDFNWRECIASNDAEINVKRDVEFIFPWEAQAVLA